MPTALVIDDDGNVGKRLSMMLRSLRLGVMTAPDAETGLNLLAVGEFDVVLVDIFMPGMDGFATIREIRKVRPDLPVIAMSGRRFTNPMPGKPDFLGMAVRLGANKALQKPFAPADLCAAIGCCLADAASPAELDEWTCPDNIVPFRTPADLAVDGIISGGHAKP